MSKYCPSCGSPLEGMEKFCPGCGANIDQSASPLPVPIVCSSSSASSGEGFVFSSAFHPASQEEIQRERRKNIAIFAAAMVLLVLFYAGIFAFTGWMTRAIVSNIPDSPQSWAYTEEALEHALDNVERSLEQSEPLRSLERAENALERTEDALERSIENRLFGFDP